MSEGASAFESVSLTRPLWPHQARALGALDGKPAGQAAYLVVPPGGGKTLIGLEAARRLGRPAVVLVLTYQALCTLGHGEGTGPVSGRRNVRDGDGLLSLLHPNGRELIARLQASGPWTLVLDECHHLLELWGRLLQAVIGQLGQPRVIGLTATPPHLMTAARSACPPAATADALRATGLASRGGGAVRIEAQPDGSYRARLEGVPAAESAQFADALEEVLSPLSQPRYVIPRLILAPPPARGPSSTLAPPRAPASWPPSAATIPSPSPPRSAPSGAERRLQNSVVAATTWPYQLGCHDH
jgi:hypothetical protein